MGAESGTDAHPPRSRQTGFPRGKGETAGGVAGPRKHAMHFSAASYCLIFVCRLHGNKTSVIDDPPHVDENCHAAIASKRLSELPYPYNPNPI